MAYILYINGHEIEVDSKAISQTRQVNDLAKLDNRQSSLTNKFIAPFTPKNVKAMGFVYMTGSQSNIPYQKNEATLFDADSGVCLIYKGWATVMQSSKKGYEIFVYDGLIDFYRRIENKTLTDIGISGLNHAKSIANIVDSWNNLLPYFYAVADYNGKNKFVTAGGTSIEINTDYQVPSARVSYIWDQVFAFAGFTYSGSYFNTQDFKNLFMSFPKPVPTLYPVVIDESIITSNITYSGVMTGFYQVEWTPTSITKPSYHKTGITSIIRIDESGAFKLSASGSIDGITTIIWEVRDIVFSNIVSTGTFDSVNEFASINALVGQSILFYLGGGGGGALPGTAPTGTIYVSISKIIGYDANFEEALVDFNATDFVKEVIQHGGLTAFKDKYSDHIEYLTMSEILQSNNIEDWSNTFQYKDIEKYKIGKYAKRNNFKYRYNTDNESHNDGYLTINDENLEDEVDILTSKIYSPEISDVLMLGKYIKTFKIWEKELQDDSTIQYKDLSGRYYFMRFEIVNVNTTLASESLNQQQAVTSVAMASYTGLSFREILINNYASIESILDKAKVIDGYFYLKPIDIERFDFKSLIYVEQLACYYLVNKINNFTKGKVTKCELIEVDYKKVIPIVGPVPNTATYITIDSFTVVGCVVTVVYSTDATIGTPINLVCAINDFGLPILTPPDPIYGHTEIVYNTAVTNTVSFTLLAGTYYVMGLNIQIGTSIINSNTVYFENAGTCVYVPPPPICGITGISISGLEWFEVGPIIPGGASRSGWSFNKNLIGLTPGYDFFGDLVYDVSSCAPYSYKYELNSALGYQTETIALIGSIDRVNSSGGFYTAGIPTAATLKVTLIKPDGTEFESNTISL